MICYMFELTVAIVFGGVENVDRFCNGPASGALVWFTCEDACTKLGLLVCLLSVCLFV